MTIRAFIANGNTYTFPTSPGDQEFNAPFGSVPAKITKLPGSDGGWDEYGTGRGASDPGLVEFTIVLVAQTRAGMQTLRDNLRAMTAWGKGRLIDTINGADRWCFARLTLPDIKEQRSGQTDLHQPVKLTYSVSDPYWYTIGNETVWGGGALWGNAAAVWAGSGSPTTITGSGTITATNNGNADTLARVVVRNNSGSTINNPRVRRIVNGATADEILYTGNIATGSELAVNPRKHSAVIAGVSVLSNLTYKNSNWIKLTPGSNALQVYVEGVADVYVRYFERFI